MNFRQVHADFHTSEKIPDIGARFSKEQFQEALKTGCVNSITVFSKCHHGWAYHPSKANEPHPHLKIDLLGAQIEAAHEIGVKLAEKLWGEKYQVVVATHLDRQSHLHNHFLVNTVSFADGKKYHRTEQDYREMQRLSDELCREYRLSVVENPQPGKSKHYGEWKAEQEQRPTWRGLVKADVDAVIRQSMTERQFFDNLRKMGYAVKFGKDISVRPPGKERFVRLARNFGETYTLEGIRQRILGQQRPERPLPEPPGKAKRRKMRGSFQNVKKVTGFRALYFHYCYLLGFFQKKGTEKQPQNRKKLHFLLREDLLKLDSLTAEIRLLARYRIDTSEQLFSCRESLEERVDRLLTERAGLNRAARKVGADSTEIRQRKQEISKELAVLRKEVKLCGNIAARSQLIREKIQIVREDQQVSGKEKTEHDQHRRRGGTDGAVFPGRDGGRIETHRFRGQKHCRRPLFCPEKPGQDQNQGPPAAYLHAEKRPGTESVHGSGKAFEAVRGGSQTLRRSLLRSAGKRSVC